MFAMSGKFARHSGGIAAIEFAIILPLMLLMYLGSFQICEMVAVKRQVTLSASSVANIVTQYASISASTDLPDILQASAVVLTPYSSSNAIVIVTLINIDASGKATVGWSQSLPAGSQRVTGQSVTIPAGLDVASSSLVLGETTYAYKPVIDFLHMGTTSLYSSVYMLPRSPSGTIAETP
jgi:Flp pilus assembly protein TadG